MNSKNNSYTGLKPNRMETLSDGVFAIVMTLLVIELSVPLVSKLKAAEELGGMLIEMWPKFLAFTISFLILGLFWFIHHTQFNHVKRSNGMFTWINIFFLMTIALIPFSTALIGEYHIYSKIEVIFWGANGFLCLLMLNIIWWYATKQSLLDKRIEPQIIKLFQIRLIIAIPTFILAIVLSFVNPIISIVIYVIIALYGITSNIIWGSTKYFEASKKALNQD